MQQYVTHLGSLSFNWGERIHKHSLSTKITETEAYYDKQFPNGIMHLLQ
jgi:hypothetical protein